MHREGRDSRTPHCGIDLGSFVVVFAASLYAVVIGVQGDDVMNLNVLEKMAREISKGRSVVRESGELLSKGFITPIEHKSLSSLSWQIAANVRANGPGGTLAISSPDDYRPWF